MPLRLFIVLLIALLCGCATLPGTQIKQINARQVEFVVSIRSSPAVVFENGLGGKMECWRKVVPEIANDATYFAYNRPGYGKSALTETPRDGSHIVEELHELLLSQGIKPPYVLVGHSLGGLYMQLFARRYPEEVAALILVDSTHPKQLEGEGAIEKQSFWVRCLVRLLVTGVAKQELGLLAQTGEEVVKLPTLTGKPVFVLSASEPMKETSDLARFANEKRIDIARMYPGSRQIWVDSGHNIPLERPEAVVNAIRAALAEVHQERQ